MIFSVSVENWSRSCQFLKRLGSVHEPDDEGQRSRGSCEAGMLERWLQKEFIISYLYARTRTEERPAFNLCVGLSAPPPDLDNLSPRVNFMPREKHFELSRKWSWQFDGGVSNNGERCQERKKNVLGLMFGNRAETPWRRGRGVGSQTNRFPHIHHLSRKYVPTPSRTSARCFAQSYSALNTTPVAELQTCIVIRWQHVVQVSVASLEDISCLFVHLRSFTSRHKH